MRNFWYPGSETVFFEIPAGLNVIFPEHSNLQVTAAASIAKLGGWCSRRVVVIEWRGGEPIANVVGVRQKWIISNDVNSGVELYRQSTYPLLVDFVKRGVSCVASAGSKRKSSSDYS